jgi:serine/threonine protein kinase/Flp pilus assembly protein TadD
MKNTDFSGLSDLPIARECARCRCGSLARIGSGFCVSCLLRTALGSDDPDIEDFDALLASLNVPDRDWQLGNYRIFEEIGRGGMGVIYRARHAPSRRIVALKRVLNYHSDSQETLTRFQREARAAASLDHPNILPIYDVGATEDGLPFFSMKFAAGGSLLDSRQNFRGMPRRAAKLISTVARAVDYAHSRGVLHRDLKPGNILLDARGEPMVSDFGLAKWLDTAGELTRTLTVFGTPGYIAPEQSETASAELTAATDVYSLGAILFELLSGRPPFLGEHALAVLRQAAENDAPQLRSIVPKASRDLEIICARCLEREPNLRYATAAALAEDLDRWLEGNPIAARPILPPVRFYRWARRNPILAISLGICLFFGGLVATRQVQSWKLEYKVRESELARNSIAVFPFLDLDSATPKSEWTAALAHALQTELSSIGTARIVPINTVGNDVKESARKFQTRTALFGTRRNTDRGTRISIQLVSSDGDLLFDQIVDLAAEFDLKPIAHGLAGPLLAVLSANDWSPLIAAKSDPGMLNERARELITAGRELVLHHTVRDLDRGINCFEKAIAIEPRSALARAYLASAAATRTHYLADADLLAYANREVEEAAHLAPSSAEVLRVLAGVKYQHGQFRKALEDCLGAIENGAPNGRSAGMLGMIYNELGRPDQGLRWLGLAKSFDPRPGEYDNYIGDCWSALGHYDKARSVYQKSNDLHPERSEALVGISHLYLLSADFAQARNLCRQSIKLNPDGTENAQLAAQIEFFGRNFSAAEKLYATLEQKDPRGGGAFYGGVSYKSALGFLAITNNRARSGRALLQACLDNEIAQLDAAPDNPDVLYRISAIESAIGKGESAIAHLQAAVSAGWIDYRSLSLDPRFDAIKDDTRFQLILGKLKLRTEELLRASQEGS